MLVYGYKISVNLLAGCEQEELKTGKISERLHLHLAMFDLTLEKKKDKLVLRIKSMHKFLVNQGVEFAMVSK